ncbi:dihydroflavonol-4-reductase [Lepidopterella palustris CBS 459.81]|uniref:Dihydroflavonol-4-reductase n=1 Tax=Lepidopterella palustris CBS 459.81 TaxID=1314670 RepID=A0A8E2DXP3_9PEZI|nr:dihydroflavonol-4-reductase [Lepidopterella palustris CBS 459.81]
MLDLALQPGALVLVTGVNGLIGSHVADQLLARGYHVRGTVRDVTKADWMNEFFGSRYSNVKFELICVPDMSKEGCYDEAVKGTAGVIHVASILSGGTADKVVPLVVAGGLNALKSAAKESSVQRVVYTSSSIAVRSAKPNVKLTFNETSYNEEAIEKAWNFPADEDERFRAIYIYGASKAQTEKEMWKWVKENKPGFSFNTVIPNSNFGKILRPDKQGYPSTTSWPKLVFEGGDVESLARWVLPQWFVDTADNARIHVATLIYEDVKNERIFAFAETYNWNKVLRIYRTLYPDRKFVDDVADHGDDISTVPNGRALELLKRCGRDGWTALEESLKALTEDLA